jgi:hypothetical protein
MSKFFSSYLHFKIIGNYQTPQIYTTFSTSHKNQKLFWCFKNDIRRACAIKEVLRSWFLRNQSFEIAV